MVAVNDKVMSEETARALFELGGAVIEARAASQGLVDVLRENKTDYRKAEGVVLGLDTVVAMIAWRIGPERLERYLREGGCDMTAYEEFKNSQGDFLAGKNGGAQ